MVFDMTNKMHYILLTPHNFRLDYFVTKKLNIQTLSSFESSKVEKP